MKNPQSLLQLLVDLRAEQRERWLKGDHVVAETYFDLYPNLLAEPDSALELVYSEVMLREEAGQKPQLDEYVRRFPQFAGQLPPLFEVHRALDGSQLFEGTDIESSDGATTSSREPEKPSPWPTIAGYEVLAELGRGGMGVVYKARHLGLNRVVALKMILTGCQTGPAYLARFRAEAEAVARLQHPNFVQIYDVGEQDGRPYFSLEFVAGGNLAQDLNGTPWPARAAATLIQTLARAMHAAHERGIVHRDLKPANVLMQIADCQLPIENHSSQSAICNLQSAIPKITDFGLAKHLDAGAGQTGSGTVLGTASYMAPEQADSRVGQVGPTSDVYSLGAILYELLTGRPPFKAETQLDTLRQLLSDEPVPLSRFHLKVPRDLNTICMKCLQKEPHKRYASALALAEDLEHFLADQPIHARRTAVSEQLWRWCRRNPAVAGLVFVVSALLMTVAVGASLAALRLHAERNATRAQLVLTEAAEETARRRLFDALLDQARASRLSRRIGQRFTTLEVLAEATKMARDMNLPEKDLLKLRNEAIACLALPDLRIAKDKEFNRWPTGSLLVDFAGTLERYARASRQGVVSVRRVADDAELYRLPGLGPGDTQPIFSPDGRFLLLERLKRVQIWNLTEPEPVLLRDELNNVWAFSPDSRRLARAHPDGSLCLYDLPSCRQIKQLAIGVNATFLAFHPRDQQLALICATGVQIRDLITGIVLAELPQPPGASHLIWHPDGKTLAVDDGDRIIHLWNVAERKQIARFEEHKSNGVTFAFNHAGDLLASACWDGILRLWDSRTGRQLFNTQAWVTSIRFSPDDHLLAAGIDDDKLRLWEVATACGYRTMVRDPVLGRGEYQGCAISPKDRLLAVGMNDGVGLWDLDRGTPLPFLPIGWVTSILFEPSGALLTATHGGVLRFSIQTDSAAPGVLRIEKVQKLPLPGTSGQLASSRDGQVLASAQLRGGVVWRQDSPEPPIPLEPHQDARYIDVSSDGRLVVTGSHYGLKVKVCEAGTGKLVRELPVETGSRVRFSPDGRWLATSGGGCRLWAVDSWQAGPRLGSWITFAFSPDGKFLAVETGYGVLRLLDPDTGREYARLEEPNQDRAGAIAFSPDGTQLVTTNNDSHSVHIWDLRTIREQLAKMGLDWDLPAYPYAPEIDKTQPLRIQVELGDQAHVLRDPKQITRQIIEQKRRAIAENPISPVACNDLAWTYLTAPEALRDPKAALPLAQRAVQLESNPIYRNTLGLAYYRAGRYREAVEVLQANLKDRVDWAHAYDLYLLAMSHHQLGDSAKAREFYELAVRLSGRHKKAIIPHEGDLTAFHDEVAGLLKVKEKD